MATLYEQIQQALNESNENEMENLSSTIHKAIETLSTYIIRENLIGRDSSIRSGFKTLDNSLDHMINKLVELESKIEELENRGV